MSEALAPAAHGSNGVSGVDEASLVDAVRDAFAIDGPVARAGEGYRCREAQVAMAEAVASAIDAREALVVEAGTGVGKTFAYLVPLLLAGRRALISTATKSLQDQLFLRDLPRVLTALGLPRRVALLKGRESYLCLHRLGEAHEGEDDAFFAPTPASRSTQRTIARIERWAVATRTGDLSEIEGLEERSPVLARVTSTRDNCLGAQCPQFAACHVVKARREAMAADVVVVNHHLFFADVALRDTGVAELLPTVDVAVFDEAHQLVDTGVQFLGQTLSSAQLLDLARDILATGLRHARGLADWPAAVQGIDRAARDLRLACGERGASRLRWPPSDEAMALVDALARVAEALDGAREALSTCSELDPSFDALAARATEQGRRARHFVGDVAPERVRWLDVSTHHVRLIETPLDIADALGEQRRRAPRAWIFTSATLGDDEALSWFCKPTGLADARTLKLGSPYDHAEHARLWVCDNAPRPEDPAHAAFVAKAAGECAALLGGRTLVLTTTLRALPRIADALRARLAARGAAIDVLVQGEHPKRVLLERLRAQARTVLVASQSFWEGVDVPGDALQCVVIDKLPFPPPNDPLVEARARRIEAEGGSAFNQFFIPETAVAMKQGAGRLIRSESDCGLLVVCDARLARMPYGKRIRRALPPMTPVASWDEARAWLAQIAVASPEPS